MGLKLKEVTELSSAERRDALVRRLEELTELPLLLLAFLMVPALVGPLFWDLSPQEASAFSVINLVVWAIFAADFAVKLALTPRRGTYLKRNWLQAVIVALPFLRPLIIVRVLFFGGRAVLGFRRMAQPNFVFVLGFGLIIIAATVAYGAERTVNAEEFGSFIDSLWWSIVTITTVGYGDMVPVTGWGRTVALFLMIGGIAFFGIIAGNLAAYLTHFSEKGQKESETQQLLREVRELRAEVERLARRG